MTREKVIIDTDIGDDIDDMLAIVFALNSPELEVMGITTVFRNTEARAKITSELLDVMSIQNIPVYIGCSKPLKHSDKQTAQLNDIPNQYEPTMSDSHVDRSEHAVDYLARTLSQTSEKITLITIGPLTNIARLLLKYPDTKANIKKIVFMGGAYYFHFREWNILCDPEAAQVVFDSGVPIYGVGLDVTKHCVLTEAGIQHISKNNSALSKFISSSLARWQKHQKRTCPILHDPLTVYAAFANDLLQWQHEQIKIELTGEMTRGLTFNATDWYRWEHLQKKQAHLNKTSQVFVAKDVHSDAFIELFIERLLGEASIKN